MSGFPYIKFRFSVESWALKQLPSSLQLFNVWVAQLLADLDAVGWGGGRGGKGVIYWLKPAVVGVGLV